MQGDAKLLTALWAAYLKWLDANGMAVRKRIPKQSLKAPRVKARAKGTLRLRDKGSPVELPVAAAKVAGRGRVKRR